MDHGNCILTDMISIPEKMTRSIIKKNTSEYMNKHQLIQEFLFQYLLNNGANKQGESEDVFYHDFHKKSTKVILEKKFLCKRKADRG